MGELEQMVFATKTDEGWLGDGIGWRMRCPMSFYYNCAEYKRHRWLLYLDTLQPKDTIINRYQYNLAQHIPETTLIVAAEVSPPSFCFKDLGTLEK